VVVLMVLLLLLVLLWLLPFLLLPLLLRVFTGPTQIVPDISCGTPA
jgi:hypothetical protein